MATKKVRPPTASPPTNPLATVNQSSAAKAVATPSEATPRRRKRHRRISLLIAIGSVFALSAVLRLGQMDNPFASPAAVASAEEELASLTGPTAPLRAALDEVERLRADLNRRETAIADRESAVAATQVLIENRIAELEQVEARLTELLSLSDTAAETDIDRLTRVYESMEPEAAAPLFAQMEPSFAAGFLSRMTPVSSAAVLANLEPQTAYAISVVLATRNASAPTRESGDAAETDTSTTTSEPAETTD